MGRFYTMKSARPGWRFFRLTCPRHRAPRVTNSFRSRYFQATRSEICQPITIPSYTESPSLRRTVISPGDVFHLHRLRPSILPIVFLLRWFRSPRRSFSGKRVETRASCGAIVKESLPPPCWEWMLSLNTWQTGSGHWNRSLRLRVNARGERWRNLSWIIAGEPFEWELLPPRPTRVLDSVTFRPWAYLFSLGTVVSLPWQSRHFGNALVTRAGTSRAYFN